MLVQSRISLLAVLLALLLCLYLLSPSPSARPASSANFLLISIDTIRPDHLEPYGYKRLATPAISELARDGVLFENAFTPIPITLPAHCSLMTGLYPMSHGVRDFSAQILAPGHTTLAEILKARGYATAAFVGAAVLERRFGLAQGFDYYHDNFDLTRLGEVSLDSVERKADEVAEVALKWLRERKGKFFAWVHLYDPHHPYEPPEPYRSRYSPYDGEIAAADAAVGRLLAQLKAGGAYDDTLIVLVGDHGEGLGEHGEKTHGFFIYDSTLRIPLIIKFPRGQQRGTRVSAQVRLIDVFPTALQALGYEVPAEAQGKSLLAYALGRARGDLELYAESYLPFYHFDWSELVAIRTGTFKYIDAPRPELYHVAKDPRELKNIYSDNAALAARLKASLGEAIARYSQNSQRAEAGPSDPETLEKLRSLGYISISGAAAGRKGRQLPDPKDKYKIYELVSEALAEQQRGRIEASIEKLNEAAKDEPNSAVVRYLLGMAYYKQKEYARAIPQFEQMLSVKPDNSLGAFHLALCYIGTNDLDSAMRWLKRTLELDPTNFHAHYNLGAIYLRKRMVDESVVSISRALEINPRFVPAHIALGEIYLYQGKVDQAIAEFKAAAEIDPDDYRAHLNLAKAYQRKGMLEEARAAFDRAKKLSERSQNPGARSQ